MALRKTKEEIDLEKKAVAFINELQNNFTEPIIKHIDNWINTQTMSDKEKSNLRHLFLITIGNSMLLKCNMSRRRFKENYRGLLADYDKLN